MGQRFTPDISAEAAAWLARLRADGRPLADEAAFGACGTPIPPTPSHPKQ